MDGAGRSLPTRERGLKCEQFKYAVLCENVAPYAGAWIEMRAERLCSGHPYVAPYAGAWIEIVKKMATLLVAVAPYAGA